MPEEQDIEDSFDATRALDWAQTSELTGQQRTRYTCGFCSSMSAPNRAYLGPSQIDGNAMAWIYICSFCGQPTYRDLDGKMTPQPSYGRDIPKIRNEDAGKLYREAQNCYQVGAFTAAVLVCRKLLLNVTNAVKLERADEIEAAGKDATREREPFSEFAPCITWLSHNDYIPRRMINAFREIPRIGGDATHTMPLMEVKEAELLINRSYDLLMMVYVHPSDTPPDDDDDLAVE